MRKRNLWMLLLTVIMLMTACGSANDSTSDEASEVYEETASAESTEPAPESEANLIDETVLCDQDGIKISASSLTEGDLGNWILDLTIDNQSDKKLSIGITELSANNIILESCEKWNAVDPFGNPSLRGMQEMGMYTIDVEAKATTTAEDVTYSLDKKTFEENNITSFDTLSLKLGVFDTNAENSDTPVFETEAIEIPIH